MAKLRVAPAKSLTSQLAADNLIKLSLVRSSWNSTDAQNPQKFTFQGSFSRLLDSDRISLWTLPPLLFSIVLLFVFSNSSHPSLYIPTYTNSKHISATSTSNASIYTHSYTYIYLYSAKSLSIFFFSISLLFSPRFFTFLLCRRAGDGK